MTEIARRVGRRIATLRKQARLTQRQLADAIGTLPEVVSRMENGVHAPSLERLDELARALHVAPRALLEEEGGDDDRAERAASAVRRLSAEDADIVITLAESLARRGPAK